MNNKNNIDTEIIDPLIKLGQYIAKLKEEYYSGDDVIKLRHAANYVLEKINEL